MGIRDKINAVKNAIRKEYDLPGGYILFGVCDDGGILCCDCMRNEFHQILWSIKNDCSNGWRVDQIESSVNLESEEFIKENEEHYSLTLCDHCNTILNT